MTKLLAFMDQVKQQIDALKKPVDYQEYYYVDNGVVVSHLYVRGRYHNCGIKGCPAYREKD